MQVPVVADNAKPEDLEPEPEGFWDPIHDQVNVWLAKYGGSDDGDTD
jgi:hypothetical protein